jgi:hypothetical protein
MVDVGMVDVGSFEGVGFGSGGGGAVGETVRSREVEMIVLDD